MSRNNGNVAKVHIIITANRTDNKIRISDRVVQSILKYTSMWYMPHIPKRTKWKQEDYCCWILWMLSARSISPNEDYYYWLILGLCQWSRDEIAVLWMIHQCVAQKEKVMGHKISAGHADCFFDNFRVMHLEFVPAGQTVDSTFYIKVLKNLRDDIWQKNGETIWFCTMKTHLATLSSQCSSFWWRIKLQSSPTYYILCANSGSSQVSRLDSRVITLLSQETFNILQQQGWWPRQKRTCRNVSSNIRTTRASVYVQKGSTSRMTRLGFTHILFAINYAQIMGNSDAPIYMYQPLLIFGNNKYLKVW